MAALKIGIQFTGQDIWYGDLADRSALGVELQQQTHFVATDGARYEFVNWVWIQTHASGSAIVVPSGGTVIDENGIRRTVNRTSVNIVDVGDTTVVTAQGPGIRIRVLAFYHVSDIPVVVKFKSGAITDISPALSVGQNGGIQASRNDHGWFQTAPNEALVANQNLLANTGVMLVWVQAG